MQAAALDQGIDITKAPLDSTISALNQVLSDEHVLLMKLRTFHWTATGPHCRELHALFYEQQVIVATRADEVAERLRALGVQAMATMSEYLHRAAISDHPGSLPGADGMLSDLLADHETVIRSIKNSLTELMKVALDIGTIDLLTDVLHDHEKMAWAIPAPLSCKRDAPQERYSVLYE